MNEMTRNPRPSASGVRKAMALFGTMFLIAAVFYASRDSLPPTNAAEEAKDKKTRTPSAVAAAEAFLNVLNDKQREKVLFDFASGKKSNWSNLPVTFVPRNGVRLADLTKDQRDKAMAVVAAVLSKEGYQKVVDIMDGDEKLTEGKGGAKGANVRQGSVLPWRSSASRPRRSRGWSNSAAITLELTSPWLARTSCLRQPTRGRSQRSSSAAKWRCARSARRTIPHSS